MTAAQPPPAYRRSGYDVDAISSAITGLDHAARQAEATWGVGRLRCLVDDELRAKFDRQRAKTDAAIASDAPAHDVVPQIQSLARGWAVLDQAARAAGHTPKPPEVWEVRLEDGSVAAIVRDQADASLVIAQGRAVSVWTLAEIGRLLHAFPTIALAKHTFPGATVERATRYDGDLPPIDWATGDEVPI